LPETADHADKTDEFRDCASDVGQRIFLSVTVLLLFSVTAETNPGGMLNISRWCKPPVIPGDKIVPSPGRGVINQSRYVIDTPESALSRRFRNEKSWTDHLLWQACRLQDPMIAAGHGCLYRNNGINPESVRGWRTLRLAQRPCRGWLSSMAN